MPAAPPRRGESSVPKPLPRAPSRRNLFEEPALSPDAAARAQDELELERTEIANGRGERVDRPPPPRSLRLEDPPSAPFTWNGGGTPAPMALPTDALMPVQTPLPADVPPLVESSATAVEAVDPLLAAVMRLERPRADAPAHEPKLGVLNLDVSGDSPAAPLSPLDFGPPPEAAADPLQAAALEVSTPDLDLSALQPTAGGASDLNLVLSEKKDPAPQKPAAPRPKIVLVLLAVAVILVIITVLVIATKASVSQRPAGEPAPDEPAAHAVATADSVLFGGYDADWWVRRVGDLRQKVARAPERERAELTALLADTEHKARQLGIDLR